MIYITEISMCKECGNIFKSPVGRKYSCPSCKKDNSFIINVVMVGAKHLDKFRELIEEKGW